MKLYDKVFWFQLWNSQRWAFGELFMDLHWFNNFNKLLVLPSNDYVKTKHHCCLFAPLFRLCPLRLLPHFLVLIKRIYKHFPSWTFLQKACAPVWWLSISPADTHFVSSAGLILTYPPALRVARTCFHSQRPINFLSHSPPLSPAIAVNSINGDQFVGGQAFVRNGRVCFSSGPLIAVCYGDFLFKSQWHVWVGPSPLSGRNKVRVDRRIYLGLPFG